MSVAGSACASTGADRWCVRRTGADAVKTLVNARITITPTRPTRSASRTRSPSRSEGHRHGLRPGGRRARQLHADRHERRAHTAPTGTCTEAGANTDATGQCTIIFTSPTAGKVTGHASVDALTVGGRRASPSRPTASAATGDAVKTFVDANIQITPRRRPTRSTRPTRSRRTSTSTPATARLRQRAGRHADHASRSFTARAFTPTTRAPRGRHGQLHDHLTSATTGHHGRQRHDDVTSAAYAHAHDERRCARRTPVRRREQDVGAARISIAPDATNEVGQPHTFTVTLLKDIGCGVRPGGGRARRRHAHRLERRDPHRPRHGTCTTPARTPTRTASARSPSPRRRRAR